ncbi:MAG: cytochrome-c oxidase, cbb3-type subunit III [Thiotrichales bacterium]
MNQAERPRKQSVQTTGHAWDGDIQEYNNPLPNWWVWAFYASVVFVLIYWLLYPAFPWGKGFTTGMFNTITFTNRAGDEVTTHWNTRSLLIADMQRGDEAVRHREYMSKVAATPYEAILSDPEMMGFVRSSAKVMFADNCAGCHGAGANGVVGLFPSLVDDDWLWGGSIDEIHETLVQGRLGFMPAYSGVFDAVQLDAVAQYVLSLSGIEGGESVAIESGREIFQGEVGGCYYCHTPAGTGLKSQGAANLTDAVWTIVDVPGAESYEAKLGAVKRVISDGVQRKMPGMKDRLSPEQIKLLTVYVHQLGGGG